MKRVLAAIAAVAMVAGSLAVRAALDDEDDAGGATAGGPVRVVCATELRAACDALDGDGIRVAVADAGTTADRLVATPEGSDPDVDAWIVTAPWAELVNDARRRARRPAVLDVPDDPVARSPLVLAAWEDRAVALAPSCAELAWKCLGGAAARGWAAFGHPEWGDVKPAISRPDISATGLLVLGQAAASYFGRAAFDRIDMDEDAGFGAWLTALARARTPDDPLERMLTQGPSASDAVGTTEAEATTLLARAARRSEVNVTYPAPVAIADVVVATAAGRGARVRDALDGDRVGAALAERGWRVPGRDAPGARRVPLPDESELPAPGVLDELRARWRAAR